MLFLVPASAIACDRYDLKLVSFEIVDQKPAYVGRRDTNTGDAVTLRVTLTNVGNLDVQPTVPPIQPSYIVHVTGGARESWLLQNTVATVSRSDRAGQNGSIAAGQTVTHTMTFTPFIGGGVPYVSYLNAIQVGADVWKGGTGCTQADIDSMSANNRTATGLPYFVIPPDYVRTTVTPDVANAGSSGDPVNTFTGEFYRTHAADLDLGGPLPLRFTRFYSSGLDVAQRPGSALGNNWRHNFDWTLSDHGSGQITVTSWRGRRITFDLVGGKWQLSGRQDIPFALQQDSNSGNYLLLDPRTRHIHSFDVTGRLIQIADGRGNNLTLTYDSAGRLSQVSDGLGRQLDFSYAASGVLSAVSDGATRSVSFTHGGDTDRDLLTVTNPMGQTTQYTYDPTTPQGGTFSWPGILVSEQRPLGNIPLVNSWNTNDTGTRLKVAQQTDALSNTTTFSYTGSTTVVTDPVGDDMQHTHKSTGELNNVARRDGTSFSLSSNSAGQRNGITDSLGATTSYDYDTLSGKPATITHANGTSTAFSYTARITAGGLTTYDRSGITHADDSSETFAYDASGNLTTYTDRAGNNWTFSYNGNGQPLTMTNPLGGRITRSFDGDGSLSTMTDASGNITTYTYDNMRRPVTIGFADNSSQTFAYDLLNRPLSVSDHRGNTSSITYDANGNLLSLTDRSGAVTTFAYDAMDRINKITDANAASSTRSYDALGRLSSITGRNGNTVNLGYDSQNRLVAVTDGKGNTSRRTFDSEGILATATTPLGKQTGYTSDSMGRITAITSPLGNTWQITYDLMGRITGMTDPLGNASTSSYDSRGMLAGRSLPESISASYSRDALGNITAIIDPNNNSWGRSYDAAGRLTTITDPLSRSETRSYDSRNRVATVTLPNSMGSYSNTYDANGNLLRQQYSDGTDLNYSYDVEDRLLGADGISLSRDSLGRITDSNGIGVTYDAGGRISSVTYAVGKTINYRYDAANQLIEVTDWASGTTTFSWDDDGQLTSINRPNGITSSYSYDDDGRIIGITHGSLGSMSFTRDAAGRMTAATRNLPTTASVATQASVSHSFDSAAQISTAGYRYDALGRITSDGSTSYHWDLASRLTAVGAVNHSYDALGYRLSRTENGNNRQYVWNLASALPSMAIERDGNAADLMYHVYTPGGMLLYSVDASSNARRFYHFDESGNTRFVTDDAKGVIVAYAHSPFGVLLSQSGNLDNPFTWQGQWGVIDDGNGLFYIRARYYDANSGRFISRDPVASTHPMKINPYQYALNNPLIYNDADGMKATHSKTWGDTIMSGLGILGAGVEMLTTTVSNPGASLLQAGARALTLFGGLDAVADGAITSSIANVTGAEVGGVNIADAIVNLAPTFIGMYEAEAAAALAAAEGSAAAATPVSFTSALSSASSAAAPYIAVAWFANNRMDAIVHAYEDLMDTEKRLYDTEARNGLARIKLARAKRAKQEREASARAAFRAKHPLRVGLNGSRGGRPGL